MKNILTIADKKDAKFLRKKTAEFDFKSMNKKEVDALIGEMKDIMHSAHGIGLAANQIGLSYRIFVAEVPSERGKKFYAIFNPTLEKKSKETVLLEEGCLSVPGSYGNVTRHTEVTLKGFDKRGRSLRIKAWGLLAHVFQHETDHLDGVVFVDKAESMQKVERGK